MPAEWAERPVLVRWQLKRPMYEFKNSFSLAFVYIHRAKYIFSRDMFFLPHFWAKIHGVICTCRVKTAKRDALTTVMSVNFVRLLQISRNFIRIAEFQGTLACHSFACLSYFCGFHFPSLAAIIQHRILLCVEDCNRKLRAYFLWQEVQDNIVTDVEFYNVQVKLNGFLLSKWTYFSKIEQNKKFVVQLRKMNMASLLDKYYWNKGILNGDEIP